MMKKIISIKNMYAFNWQHDCFSFSPKEKIPFEFEYYDEESNCNVCFPTYFPNGDYYFFINADFNIGLFGHPWRQEIKVMGKELIEMFEKNIVYLNISKK